MNNNVIYLKIFGSIIKYGNKIKSHYSKTWVCVTPQIMQIFLITFIITIDIFIAKLTLFQYPQRPLLSHIKATIQQQIRQQRGMQKHKQQPINNTTNIPNIPLNPELSPEEVTSVNVKTNKRKSH